MQFVKLMADSIALIRKAGAAGCEPAHLPPAAQYRPGFREPELGASVLNGTTICSAGNYYPTCSNLSSLLQESASTTNLEKNRFSSTPFYPLPVMLGFETKPWDTDHSFRMGFGYSPGPMVKGKTKIKDDRGTNKVKR